MARTTIDADLSSSTPPAPWMLVLAILGGAMATAEIISGSMMPLMADGLNTTEGMVGQAVTATALVAIVTSLSIGKIAGNHDRRTLMMVLTLFLIASNLGVAMAPNVWFMLAARLLLGAAIGIIWGLIPAVVLRLSPPGTFAKSFSTVMIGVAFASVVAAPAAAYIGDILSWRAVYFGATLLATTALFLLWRSFPALPARPGALDRDLGGTFRLPGMISGMFGIMLLFGGAQAFYGYLVPYLEEITGLGATGVAIALLLIGVSGLAGTIFSSRLLGRSIHAVMVGAPAALCLLLGLLLISGSVAIIAMIVLMLWSFARANMGVGANAWIAHTFPENVEGAGGILVAVIQGAMMLGAVLGGVLIDNIGAKAPPTAAAIILGVGAVYCIFALKPQPIAPEHAELDGVALTSPIESTPIAVEEIA